jgi:hypothetical protein
MPSLSRIVGRTPAPATEDAGLARDPSARVPDRAWATNVAFETKTARILTWNNVVLQSVTVADLGYINSLGAAFRRQLRSYPKGLVSLVVFPDGFQPAPQPVRQAMSRLLEETEGLVHHVLVVENTGIASQLLITVIRGVLVLGGHSSYALKSTRADGIAATLPHVVAASATSQLGNELTNVLTACCQRP